jgi:hypothetical protein
MLIALMEAPIALQKCGLEARTQAYGWWNQGKERRKKKPGLHSSPELQAGEMHRLVLRITAERCLDHEKL